LLEKKWLEKKCHEKKEMLEKKWHEKK